MTDAPGRARRFRRVALTATGAMAGAGLAVAAWLALPPSPDLLRPSTTPAVVVEDRFGRALRATRAGDGSLHRWVSLAELDPDVLVAFVAVEDRRFHEHAGVDPRALARAARDGLRAGRVVSGGSTITMQLARLLLGLDRGWTAKARQLLWAWRLELHLDKQTILEQYLNRVPLGQGAVGVPAAAALYFGAEAGELSLGQAALLAGLARAPSADNPLVSPRRAAARRSLVLRLLAARGHVRPEEAARAAEEPVLATGRRQPFLAPHFTTRFLERLERAEAAGGGSGLRGAWRTSLDLELQAALEAEVGHTVAQLRERGGRHAAVVVLENAGGGILAWVGSPDFWADTAGQVDMVVSPRQPGSTLKPFLYALAFDRGYTAATVLADVARTYRTSTGPYNPRNYDRRFHGPVRAREALASSYNLPAVALADRLGAASFLRILQLAGFESLRRSAEFYGLGLALGNGDVSLLELANGYRALANRGVHRPVEWLAVPTATPPPGRRVVSARSAALVLDILRDPAARAPGFGLETPFDFPFPAAVKTGTSRHFTDNWAVGVSGGFTVAVWVGDFSGRPMQGVSGVSGAGPLLQRAMLLVARRYPPGELPSPAGEGAVPRRICRLSGALAGARCPALIEWFGPGTEPRESCDWHREDGVVLPVEFAEWARQNPGLWSGGAPATRRDDGSAFRIVSPRHGDRYRLPPGVDPRYATIALRASGAGDAPVRWFVDGRETRGSRWPLTPGEHLVRAEAATGEADQVRIVVDPEATR